MTDRPKCASHQVGYRHCPLWAKFRVLVSGARWCSPHTGHQELTARFPLLQDREDAR